MVVFRHFSVKMVQIVQLNISENRSDFGISQHTHRQEKKPKTL